MSGQQLSRKEDPRPCRTRADSHRVFTGPDIEEGIDAFSPSARRSSPLDATALVQKEPKEIEPGRLLLAAVKGGKLWQSISNNTRTWEDMMINRRALLVSVRKHFESFESFVIQSGDLIREGAPPMWTAKNRGRYDRSKLRYPSNLTDDEWAHVEPLIPPAKRGGTKRHVEVSEVMNGIMYILSTGCQWRAIPKDLPPRSTLFHYLDLWSYDGTLDCIHHALYVECREQGEREASPSAAIVDSQSVKSAEKGGPASIRMATTRAKRSRGRSAIFS